MRSLQRLSVLVAATASVALFAGTAAQSSGEIIGLWDFEEFATHNELQSGPFANHAPASSMATASTLSNVGIGARVALTSTLDGVFGPLPSMMYAPSAGGFNKAAPVAADDYLGFSLTSAQSGLALSDFTFDLGVSNNSNAFLDPG